MRKGMLTRPKYEQVEGGRLTAGVRHEDALDHSHDCQRSNLSVPTLVTPSLPREWCDGIQRKKVKEKRKKDLRK